MKLLEFIDRFEGLGDKAFLANFTHPFLLQEGRLLNSGPTKEEREVFLLRANPGRSMVLGRGKACELRLQTPHASSQHAVLMPPDQEGDPWRLLDTDSTNGTFVEGAKLTPGDPVPLEDGAVISFGPEYRFTFVQAESFLKIIRRLVGAGVGPDPSANFLGNKTDPELEAVQDMDSGIEALKEGEEDAPVLICCEPFDPMPLELGQSVVVGRSPNTAAMVLPHPNVSRQHTEIQRRADGIFIRDLGSANGTFIGKTRVGSQLMELLLGKKVMIGPYTLVLEGPSKALSQTTIVPTAAVNEGIEGKLADTALLDLFQEIENGQHTGSLELKSKFISGVITFRAGEPHGAFCNNGLNGDEAIKALLQLREGEYNLRTEAAEVVGPRQITLSFSELALDDFLSSH